MHIPAPSVQVMCPEFDPEWLIPDGLMLRPAIRQRTIFSQFPTRSYRSTRIIEHALPSGESL
jgi:hypothetical protein